MNKTMKSSSSTKDHKLEILYSSKKGTRTVIEIHEGSDDKIIPIHQTDMKNSKIQ
jgi:hypothetical protein